MVNDAGMISSEDFWARLTKSRLGIVTGLAVGWFLPDYGSSLLLAALAIILGLTIRNLLIGFNQWKRDPTRVEALAGAIDVDQFERIAHDVDAMRRLATLTLRVVSRYIGVCFALNFISVCVSAIPSFAFRMLLKMVGR